MNRLSKSILVVCAMAAADVASAQGTGQLELGKRLFEYSCETCHGPGLGANGGPLPGTNALKAKYKGEKPALLSERTDLTPELVTFFVRNGISIMPFFRKTELSDADLVALSAYVARNYKP